MIRPDVFGWFDDPTATAPAHDPGMGATCPACGCVLQAPVKTISLMPRGGDRSYFFRAHKACWETIGEDDRTAIESSLIDAVVAPLYPHDCKHCIFLGQAEDPHDGPCDLYVCKCSCGCDSITLIARFGPDGYSTRDAEWPDRGDGGAINEAGRRARARRLFGLKPR